MKKLELSRMLDITSKWVTSVYFVIFVRKIVIYW